MRVVFHLDSGLLNGIVSALPTALGAGAVIAFGSVSSRVTSIAGVTSIAIGATILALAIAQGPLALFLVGTAIAGAGFGAAFSGSIRQIAPMVEAHQRAELFAAVYTVSYLAFGIPAIAAGLLVGVIGLPATVLGYLAALVVAAVIGVVTQTRRLRAH
jgi:MFS family permease